MKFGPLTLKWRIILFYFMLGFMPLLTISYISYDIASKSIRGLTNQQMTQLMDRIAQQTKSAFHQAEEDIYQMSQNPVIQLSFLQFTYGQRMETLKERLAVYRTNSEKLDIIALYTPQGEPVLTSPVGEQGLESIITSDEIKKAYMEDFSVKQHLAGDDKKIVLMKRVYDYENETEGVGLLVFVMPVKVMTDLIEHFEVAEGMIKQVMSSDGSVIYRTVEESAREHYSVYKQYSVLVDELGWEIRFQIPEKALLQNIITLRNTSLLFSLFIAFIAFSAAILFVQRILTPVRYIIRGTKRFSEGDFDYRINMPYGKEMKMLADSFDHMAENLQKRQNELVQANKLASLGLMSAGIAHEIKNPLAAIKTSVQVIKRRVRTEASQQLSDGILQEVDRLNKIVSDLLNFSRPGPANIVIYDLKNIVSYCLQLMNKDLKDKNVKVIDETKRTMVMVDPAQMQQIILNLLLNSLLALGSDGGVIALRTEEDEGVYILEIEDNGRGIPEDKLDKIFDPFFSMTAGGTGLGLSVVFTLLKQNNIEHKISSREGEGTCFRLIFKNRGGSGEDSDY